MADRSDLGWNDKAWKRVPWAMQNFIFFYLRTHHFRVTARNIDLVAKAIADRLDVGPVEHRDLEVVIDLSAVEYLLDEDTSGP